MAVACLATACPGDDGPTAEGSTSDDTTSTSTTSSTTTTTDPGSSSSDTTTTGPADSSTSMSDSSSSGGAESSTGDQPGSGYGDCVEDVMSCAAGEVCMQVGPIGSVCSEQGCDSPADCDMPPSGDATPACDDVNGNFSIDCYLDCAGGATCPDGMFCAFDTVCIWPAVAPGGGMCPDEDLGNIVPQMVMGDNTGLFDDAIPSCGGGGGEDSLYLFTAPADGTYRFDTAGTGFDTTLSLRDGCEGLELICDDDAPMVLTSELDYDLLMDQQVVVVVDSFNGEVGPFNLNITQVMP